MVNLTIDPSAYPLIAKKGNVISVKVDKKTAGCGRPLVRVFPEVDKGRPKDKVLAEYTELLIGDITVFAHKSLEEYEQLEVFVTGTLLGKKMFLRCTASDGGNCFG